MSLADVLEVADAVLYEGYLLYPYRSTSTKNQVRWQFGVLGPPGAAAAGLGEEPALRTECLLQSECLAQTECLAQSGCLAPPERSVPAVPGVTVHLRFLHLQHRSVEQADAAGGFVPASQLDVQGRSVGTWDEAVECHLELGRFSLADLVSTVEVPVDVAGSEYRETVEGSAGSPSGRLVRRRWPLRAAVRLSAIPLLGSEGDDRQGRAWRLAIEVANVHDAWDAAARDGMTRDAATRSSFLGAHLVLEAADAAFVSLLEPPGELAAAANECRQHRCWPVLAGEEGATDRLLVSPIILYDYPAVAPESAGALFDSTEIDEILTLRVMTLTDEEKAEARATDPAAAAIIDRCEQMRPEDLQRLHGIMRDPRGSSGGSIPPGGDIPSWHPDDIPTFVVPVGGAGPDAGGDVPWWDPGADSSVSPSTDAVEIDGVTVAKGSSVRLHPRRNADAQDLFYAARTATVTAVLADVDGGVHIAVVVDDDPAADLHEWYGRYLYFAPDEIEPLDAGEKGGSAPREPPVDKKEDA